MNNHSNKDTRPDRIDLFIRELVNALDLIIEATFFAGLYAENPLMNLY